MKKVMRCMLSLVLSSSLVSLGYSLPAVGQQQVFPSSGAVYKETLSVLAGVYNRIRARNATAGDFQSAGIALRILFAHWEETGINARIQAHIAEQAELLRSYTGPADEQVHALYAQLSLAGVAVSVEEVRRLLNVSRDRLERFLAEYNRPGGIQKWETQVVNLFFQLAAKSRATGIVFQTSNFEENPMAVLPVMQESSTQENICFYSGALALYTGVIAYVCVICAPVAAPISLISTAVSFITC